MSDLRETVLEAIRMIVNRHPRLAPRIEALAAQAQGRSAQDLADFIEWKRYQGMDLAEIFTSIYAEGRWGRDEAEPEGYFSGTGTRTPEIAGAYVAALRSFAAEFGHPPSVVDLGCGDFHIGAQIRPLFGAYTACDIVPGLIERNRQRFGVLGVDFRCLDITTDDLPHADVILVRQVLQHLSNRDIAGFVRRVAGACRHLVVTEHWPALDGFTPNAVKPSGSDIRLAQGSGSS
jgi:SAM-dependent methyltransferase